MVVEARSEGNKPHRELGSAVRAPPGSTESLLFSTVLAPSGFQSATPLGRKGEVTEDTEVVPGAEACGTLGLLAAATCLCWIPLPTLGPSAAAACLWWMPVCTLVGVAWVQLASSQFCGVFPGDGFSSRFADSVLQGCIPVIIQVSSSKGLLLHERKKKK